jgi:hypothetical protein
MLEIIIWIGTVGRNRSEQILFLLKPLIRESEDSRIRRDFGTVSQKSLFRRTRFSANTSLQIAAVMKEQFLLLLWMVFERSSSIERTIQLSRSIEWLEIDFRFE